MPPDPSNPYVTSAKFAGGQMTFKVLVDDFQSDEEEYVEISGYATQTGGAFANIYQIAAIPAKANNTGKKDYVEVTAKTGPKKHFRSDQEVTVSIRVAKVWITVLGINPETTGLAAGERVHPSQPPNDGTTWDDAKEVSEMYDPS
jgi:hypothetical protein